MIATLIDSIQYVTPGVLIVIGTLGVIAAAFAVVPIAVMGVYLAIAKRFGAFDAL